MKSDKSFVAWMTRPRPRGRRRPRRSRPELWLERVRAALKDSGGRAQRRTVQAALEGIEARHGAAAAGRAVEAVIEAANGASFAAAENDDNEQTIRALAAIEAAIGRSARVFLPARVRERLNAAQAAVVEHANVVRSRPRNKAGRPQLDPMLGERYVGRDGLVTLFHELGVARRDGRTVVAFLLEHVAPNANLAEPYLSEIAPK